MFPALARAGVAIAAATTEEVYTPAAEEVLGWVKPRDTGGTDLGTYDLGFQGREGTTELGQYDLGSEDLGHASRSRSAENALMHLQRESTTEADYALETELKQQGSSFVAALVHCYVVNCWIVVISSLYVAGIQSLARRAHIWP